MPISQEQKKHFQAIGHHLKPVVIIAKNGLSEGVISELERALLDHELIKIKLAISSVDERKELLNQLSLSIACETIQNVGKTALIYKKAAKPNKKLSNILRYQKQQA